MIPLEYSVSVLQRSVNFFWYSLAFTSIGLILAVVLYVFYVAHVLIYDSLPLSLPFAFLLFHCDNIILHTLGFIVVGLYAHFK